MAATASTQRSRNTSDMRRFSAMTIDMLPAVSDGVHGRSSAAEATGKYDESGSSARDERRESMP